MAKSHSSCSETGRETVSHWSDVIKSSKQIAAKPRETHLLNTVREDLSEDGLIRRWRFGRKDPKTRNRTIILVGETGTGKSTLINMMLNYMLGVKWEDKVRFQIIRDEGGKSKTESQTSAIMAYEIYGLENLSVPFSLTVIDTPGFGGTDGPEKDKITAQNLYKLFSSSSIFKQIDAVCLVMKASQNRMSSSQKYIFDTILSLFGKNMEKNIMILITFSDWTPPAALNVVYEAGVPFSKDVNNEPVHFQFNNLPPHNFAWKYKEEYQTGWNKGTNSFRKFFKTLDKMEPQSVERAVKVSGERLSPPAVELPGNSAMAQPHTSCSETGREAISHWSDVIKSSEQITASEPIQTYLLNTDRKDLIEDGLIRRWRFGRKDPKTRNRTIILVGETGTGKSTLINMMLNYMLGVKWEDKVRFRIIQDERGNSKTESQTTAVTVYDIFGLENLTVPFSLTVIDTPGFGDTRGPEKDKLTAQYLYELLKSLGGIEYIDAACIVVKASENHITPSQKYIFDVILSLFGKQIEKNVLTLITFTDWTPPSALKAITESGVPLHNKECGEPVHFLFNNLPLEKPAKEYEEAYKMHWNKVIESMGMFINALDEMEAHSMRITEKIMEERQKLDDCVQRLENQIEDVKKTCQALEQKQKTLSEQESYTRDNKNFESEHKETVIKEVQINSQATCCTVCKMNCHYPGCWWVKDLSWCSVMKNSKCTVCPDKCSYMVHKKENKIYQPFEETRMRTDEVRKREAEEIMTATKSGISALQQEMKKLEDEKTNLITSCFQSIDYLRELALKFLSDSTLRSIKMLIEILLKSNYRGEAEKLQKMLEEANSNTKEGEKAENDAGE